MEQPGCVSTPVREVTVAWLGGVVLSGIGGGLALVGLTMPWIVAKTGAGARSGGIPLSALRSQGQTLSLLMVVIVVVSAILLSASRRPTAGVRLLTAGIGPLPAVAVILLGLQPPRAALAEVLGQNAQGMSVEPAQGLLLFAAGLLLLGFGPVLASWATGPALAFRAEGDGRPARRRSTAVVVVGLVLAVVPVVLSLSLPWFETEVTVGESALRPFESWTLVYRIALFGVLALMVGAAVAADGLRRILRSAALYLCYGNWGVLVVCALLLWDPLGLADQAGMELGTVRLGSGYLAALVAVPLLLVALISQFLGPEHGLADAAADEPEAAAVDEPDAAAEVTP
ncbi:hypothetical protein OG943_29560 [Amycolatopsis sp. NBC_00345]|uniref:hypothetical protein n=1 Tax=Amycolatopsis sp. NBC_00345 TaxID=2975955 RepID=UPI002E262EE4